jgi:hypothetical protein
MIRKKRNIIDYIIKLTVSMNTSLIFKEQAKTKKQVKSKQEKEKRA